ncbi:endo-1,4-beta-xylanase [Williamsia phyllosphaerae]|uniref:GH10 domain-containing protein n=1 Tax=Williamsia phyllosphaerae TaxID=885042 RepID=A0ABQ1UCR7_9NOCA|nr:endo-1,4-beta-xylanase [Williamsia phyllosphaerae]GGF13142.1 hypothetical protein GCM10007298_06370 [Williamsia phyllosphaerae]
MVGSIAFSMFVAFAAGAMLPTERPAYNIVNAASISNSPNTVGISDNDLYLTAGDPASVKKHLDELQALGVTNIRIAIPWAAVEASNGNFDWTLIDNMVSAADARGMGILGVVNTTPGWARGQYTNLYAPPDNPATYANFMTALATRYTGKIGAYEVWNEPNAAFAYSSPNGPDPAGYTALLKAAYTAIKAADPKATVIGGVLGATVSWGSYALNPIDFVTQMYAAGAKGYFDALSYHPYQYTLPFSTGVNAHPDSPLNQLNAIYALMQANGDGTKSIWSSEYGLPTGLVGEQQQADYISDFLNKWSSLPYAGPNFLYTTVDRNSSDTNDPESTFGLFRDNWVAKLAATVVKNWIAAHPVTTPPTTPTTPVLTPAEQAAQAWAAALNAAIAQYFANLAAALAAALSGNAAPAAPATTTANAAVTQAAATTTAPTTATTTAPTTTTPTTTTPTTAATTTATTTAPATTTPSTTTAPVTTTAPTTAAKTTAPVTTTGSATAPTTSPVTTTPATTSPTTTATTTPKTTTPAATSTATTAPATSTASKTTTPAAAPTKTTAAVG